MGKVGSETYFLGCFLMKAGIRKCNFQYFMCGKDMVSPVFFAFNHPHYRKLSLYFDYDLALMPEEMYDHVRRTIGIRLSTVRGNL